MSGPAMLRLEKVGKTFGGFRALKEVTFDVAAHGITGLIGPNGSGKTTLFNIISGFVSQTSGRVIYQGADIGRETVQARSRMGLVRTFQTPKIFERLTVEQNVMVGSFKSTSSGLWAGMLNTAASRNEAEATRASALACCRLFDLGGVASRQAALLPAGQRRLLELARAYQSKPKLLMLDEPSSGLTTTEIEAMIEKLHLIAADGISILLVSHDMDLMRIASQINVLNFGQIICSGHMNDVQQDATVREAYLGV